ncbi:hypothetical protein CEXT_554061 [Caerostris extrusa]|uniref:Uncharacterized protein n=1 Tax=Caerostris extrusa TaxID=172846 RepID=A0AAV4PDR0_CAEEX|nr:hypothetical protein CEXT_554061 [Caerostris extrusa]
MATLKRCIKLTQRTELISDRSINIPISHIYTILINPTLCSTLIFPIRTTVSLQHYTTCHSSAFPFSRTIPPEKITEMSRREIMIAAEEGSSQGCGGSV